MTFLNLKVIIEARFAAWYNYAVVIVLLPIGIYVLFKIFVQYKIIRLGNNQVQIDFPVMRKTKKYPLDEIIAWRENIVKTGKKSEYKELQILFSDKNKISVGHKEHTEYVQMVKYLTQKVAKKRTASE